MYLSKGGTINEILVQEVSRLERSKLEVLKVLEELSNLEGNVYVQNFGIETMKKGKSNPVAHFMFTLLAEFVRLERETLRERILAGIEQARRKAKKFGCPDGSKENTDTFLKKYPLAVRNLRLGISIRKTSKICGVSINTVRKVNHYLTL